MFYGTETGFNTYHTMRGTDVTDATLVEEALLVASEYIDNAYRSSWPGYKTGEREQVRDWPRSEAYDANGDWLDSAVVPIEVENATYELALKHLSDSTALTKDYTPPKYTRARVEGATDVNYAMYGSASDVQTQFLQVAKILSNVVASSGTSTLSGRATR